MKLYVFVILFWFVVSLCLAAGMVLIKRDDEIKAGGKPEEITIKQAVLSWGFMFFIIPAAVIFCSIDSAYHRVITYLRTRKR